MTKIDPFQFASELEVFSSGQTIFSEGESGDKMYVVAEGELDISVQGKVVETVGQDRCPTHRSRPDECR